MKKKVTVIISVAVAVMLVLAVKISALGVSEPQTNGTTNQAETTATQPNGSQDGETIVVTGDPTAAPDGNYATDGYPSSASLKPPTGGGTGSYAHYAIIVASSSILSSGSIWICAGVLVIAAGAFTALIIINKKKKIK